MTRSLQNPGPPAAGSGLTDAERPGVLRRRRRPLRPRVAVEPPGRRGTLKEAAGAGGGRQKPRDRTTRTRASRDARGSSPGARGRPARRPGAHGSPRPAAASRGGSRGDLCRNCAAPAGSPSSAPRTAWPPAPPPLRDAACGDKQALESAARKPALASASGPRTRRRKARPPPEAARPASGAEPDPQRACAQGRFLSPRRKRGRAGS